jgi:hypothetical protein
MWRMENKTINKQFCCGMSINLASVFIICFVGFFNNTFNIRTPSVVEMFQNVVSKRGN